MNKLLYLSQSNFVDLNSNLSLIMIRLIIGAYNKRSKKKISA